MSDRMKPTELALVTSLEAGEVLEAIPEATESEKILDSWQSGIYRGAQILDMAPQSWKVPGWLPSDSLIAVYAAPGIGKSFYALTLALEVARGGEWVGTPLEETPVLYVAAERFTVLRDRAEAWSESTENPIPENLLWHGTRPAPQLTNPSHIAALVKLIEAEKVGLVVLDTYAMMTQGVEENSSKDTGVIMESLSQLRAATNGGAVVIVHHAGKDSSKGMRGSSAFLGAVDLTIEIASGGDGQISATVRKSNAGAEPMPEWYKIESVNLSVIAGEARTSAVLTHTGSPSLGGKTEAAILEMFATSYLSTSASKKELLQDLEEQGHKVSESSLRRYLSSMVKAKKLIQEGNSSRTRYRLAE